jgi:hypothetical protein
MCRAAIRRHQWARANAPCVALARMLNARLPATWLIPAQTWVVVMTLSSVIGKSRTRTPVA